jgi:amino-acid N-acetyltransferase
MNIQIASALSRQRPGLEALLMANGLPVSDLPASLNGFYLALDEDVIVGAAGMEQWEDVGLLRSVAVAESHRNQHLARQLTDAVLSHARMTQVREMYLITNTADRYFEKYGFQRVERSEVPPPIAQTEQFAGLCPSSAVVMKMTLH